jgi:lysophospholipase L1-like esterase
VFDLHAYDYEQRPGFPWLIQNALRQEGYPVHVINAGLPGHDTRDLPAKVLLDLHRYRPDIIVVSSIWNDTKWISHASEETLFLAEAPKALQKNPMIEQVNALDNVLGFSVFYRKARDLYWQKKLDLGQGDRINEGISRSKNPEIKDFARGLDQYRANLVGVIRMIQTIGAMPVLAIEERLVSAHNTLAEKEKIQYHVVNVASHDELVHLYQRCDDILQSVAQELRVPLIDIHEEMEGKLAYFRDHVHTTPLGSELIAEVRAALREL